MGTRRDVASRRSAPSGHVATTTLQRGPFSRCHKVPFLLAISISHKNWLNSGGQVTPLAGVALRRRVASSLPACTRSRALGVPVFGGVGPPVAACATIAGRFVHLWPVREPRRTGGRCPATAAPGHAPVPGGRAPLRGAASYEAEG